MKADPIDHVRKKIEWANQHISAFERREKSFFESAPYAPNEKTNAVGERFLKFVITEPIPDELILIVGDCLYNLRASLDYLAGAAARLKVSNSKGAYFPFAGDVVEFMAKKAQGKINALPDAARPIIEGLKPYKGGDDLLYAINRVRNSDGHAFLTPLGTLGRVASVSFMEINKVEFLNDGNLHSLVEGVPFAKLQHDSVFKPRVGFEDKAAVKILGQVAFGDVEIVQGKPVAETLKKMRELCTNIANTFESKLF